MQFIIVGCGRMGAELARRLSLKQHQVAIIDDNPANFGYLHPAFDGRTIQGDALSQEVLHRAGIEEADGLAAMTRQDALNAVIGHAARVRYNIANVVIRNYNPRWMPVYETFKLQTVSSTNWGAQRIEEALYETVTHNIFSAGHGEVGVYQVTVPERWIGQPLHTLLDNRLYAAVAITRAGRALFPTPESTLEEGDLLYISTTCDGLETLLGQQTSCQREA